MFYTRCYVALIIMEIITESKLNYMCSHETKYMDIESKKICEKYLVDKQVTDKLLKVYAEKEIETWGDMVEGLIEFKYENIIIKGRYNEGDYPAEIVDIFNIQMKKYTENDVNGDCGYCKYKNQRGKYGGKCVNDDGLCSKLNNKINWEWDGNLPNYDYINFSNDEWLKNKKS